MKSFFISNLKHMYMIMDEKDLKNGLSYFDISRVFENRVETGTNFKDNSMWL